MYEIPLLFPMVKKNYKKNEYISSKCQTMALLANIKQDKFSKNILV